MLPVAAAGLQRRVIHFLKRYFIYRLTGVMLWPFLVIYIKHYFNNLYMTHHVIFFPLSEFPSKMRLFVQKKIWDAK